MSYIQRVCIFLLLTVLLSPSIAAFAQPSANALNQQPDPTPDASAVDDNSRLDSLEEKVDDLTAQVAGLVQKIENPQKEWYEIIESLSGLITGGLIAGVSLYITTALRKREVDSEQLKTEKEIVVSQAELVQGLLPSLQSNNDKEKAAALQILASLGNPELANDLFQIYGDLPEVLIATASLSKNALSDRHRAARSLSTHPGYDKKAIELLVNLLFEKKADSKFCNTVVTSLNELQPKTTTLNAVKEISFNHQEDPNKRIKAMSILQASLDERQTYLQQRETELLDLLKLPNLDNDDRKLALDVLTADGAKEKAVELLRERAQNANLGISERLGNMGGLKHLGLESEASHLRKQLPKDTAQDAIDIVANPIRRFLQGRQVKQEDSSGDET